MMDATAARRIHELATLFAEQVPRPSTPLLERLDPEVRVRVVAALVVIIALGGLMLIGVRAGGRIARWYVNYPGNCRLPSDGRHDRPGDRVQMLLPNTDHVQERKPNDGGQSTHRNSLP